VKRAIGLPGDTIDIHDNAVWINGQRLGKTTRSEKQSVVETSEIKMPYKVPENCYFANGR